MFSKDRETRKKSIPGVWRGEGFHYGQLEFEVLAL